MRESYGVSVPLRCLFTVARSLYIANTARSSMDEPSDSSQTTGPRICGKSRPVFPPTSLTSLRPYEEIYQGVDDEGNLCFRDNLTHRPGGHRRFLPWWSALALGLMEICCKVGQGKVRVSGANHASQVSKQLTFSTRYTICKCLMSLRRRNTRHVRIQMQQQKWCVHSIECRDSCIDDIGGAHRTKPYGRQWLRPVLLTAIPRRQRRSLLQPDRLQLLHARGGGLFDDDIVMPIDVTYDPIERVIERHCNTREDSLIVLG